MKKKLISLTSLTLLFVGATCALAEEPAQEVFNKQMETYLKSDANIQKIADAMRQYFEKQQAEEKKKQEVAEKEEMEKQFKDPVKVDLGDSAVKGPASAPITIVEFSEFQCPFCSRGSGTLDELVKMYPDKIKLAFKHFPLPFHPEAVPASKAALAAKEQGKFWEMHDLLFKNQQKLGKELYEQLAAELKLDVEKFKKDMEDPKLDAIIKADTAQGEKLGVQGTPGFFVNGIQVRGARPAEYFKPIIDRLLGSK